MSHPADLTTVCAMPRAEQLWRDTAKLAASTPEEIAAVEAFVDDYLKTEEGKQELSALADALLGDLDQLDLEDSW